MAHQEQAEFCQRIAARWPHLFQNKRVLDCGSLDINGNNRHLFTGGSYLGIDLVAGPNVDVVTRIHKYVAGPFDVVISTECFEHDSHFAETFSHIIGFVVCQYRRFGIVFRVLDFGLANQTETMISIAFGNFFCRGNAALIAALNLCTGCFAGR